MARLTMGNIIKWVRRWLNRKGMYVVLNASDTSVTFSKSLYRALSPELHAIKPEDDEFETHGRVMVFYEPQCECYGFTISPKIRQATQLADVQINNGDVGFESLVPTVARILHDYGVKSDVIALNVTKVESPHLVWWRIERP